VLRLPPDLPDSAVRFLPALHGRVDELDNSVPAGRAHLRPLVPGVGVDRVQDHPPDVVLVLVEGRPRTIDRIADNAGAVLMAYNPGNEGGQAVADVLFGDFNPCGKLPFTYPRAPNALLTYDRKAFEDEGFDSAGIRSQFDFGEGLSYTTFSYKDLRLSARTIGKDDQLSVSITVTNSGRRAGKEVVQLYVSDLVASLSPPAKRLKRFAKIYLNPGQSRTLTFRLGPDDLSFIGADNKPVIEPGEFQVSVGGLKDKFELK